jgi:alcohol dehydrogenase, propanol-preferring
MSQQPEKTMKAVRFVGAGCPAQVVDVPIPRPGPGEILVKIGGAGACHSDLHVLKHGRRGAPPQFTLGHENAGWIAALGSGIRGWKEGDAVAVYPLWGCGQCPACAKSAENYCVSFRPEMPRQFGGLGRDGGMAEYMLVPDGRLLVRLGQVDPKAAAPLTDAALYSDNYDRSRSKRHRWGRRSVHSGVGKSTVGNLRPCKSMQQPSHDSYPMALSAP